MAIRKRVRILNSSVREGNWDIGDSADASAGLSSRFYRQVAGFGASYCQRHPSNHIVAARLSVPVHAVQLILAIEDKRFWIHPGIDPISIGRAALMRLGKRGRRQGGSTIPEQIMKLRTPTARPVTLMARSYRAVKSVALVARYDKIDILTDYLSCIYFGRNCFGIRSASEYYFCSSAEGLTAPQSFFLADRIALPNKWRVARIANILRRFMVCDMLGEGLRELPVIYGRSFGLVAGNAVQNIVDSLVGR